MTFLHTRGAGHVAVPSPASLLTHISIAPHGCLSKSANLLAPLHSGEALHVTLPIIGILSAISGIAGHGFARATTARLLAASFCYT